MLLMLLLLAMNVFEISGVAEPIAPPVMQQKFSAEAVSVGVMPSRAQLSGNRILFHNSYLYN